MAPSAVAPEPYSRHLYSLKLYLDCETAPHALDLLGSGTGYESPDIFHRCSRGMQNLALKPKACTFNQF